MHACTNTHRVELSKVPINGPTKIPAVFTPGILQPGDGSHAPLLLIQAGSELEAKGSTPPSLEFQELSHFPCLGLDWNPHVT